MDSTEHYTYAYLCRISQPEKCLVLRHCIFCLVGCYTSHSIKAKLEDWNAIEFIDLNEGWIHPTVEEPQSPPSLLAIPHGSISAAWL